MDYPEKGLWELPMIGLRDNNGVLLKDPNNLRLARWGSVTNDFDLDAHINSEDGRLQALQWERVIRYTDEMDPNVLAYWEKLGWKKELHNADNRPEKWSSFMPLSAYKTENKGKKYPLYIILHGGQTPPYEMEGYGLVEPTAKDEAICVIPQNFEIPGVLGIYRYCVEHFPVDRSRVYCISYCGGAKANCVGLRYPELFAGIAPSGNPLRENYKPTLWYPDYERLRRIGLPIIHCDGLDDVTQLLPVYAEGDPQKSEMPEFPGKTWNMPLGKRAYKVSCLRDLLYIGGCKDVTEEEVYACEYSKDPVIRAIGVPADATETVTVHGKKNYLAKFRNGDGNYWLQICGVESMGHFPDSTMGVTAWEFLRQFRRNQETGKIEVIGETEPSVKRDIGTVDFERYQNDIGNREKGYNTAWDGTPI